MSEHGNTHDAGNAIFFHIGTFDIRTYSVCIMLGMIASIWSIWYFWRREGYSSDTLLLMIIVVIPASIIGGRIWYVIGRPPTDTNPWYAVWDGGLAIQGAVMVSALAGIITVLVNRNTLDVRKAITIILPNVLIGQVIGRWGNFANHEVFGRLSTNDFSWLGNWIRENMFFFGSNRGASATGYYVPLFLIESVINFFGWIGLVWFLQTRSRRKWFKPGTVGALYFLWYGIVRWILEPFRNPSDILHWHILGFDMEASVVTAIIYALIGVAGIIYFQFVPSKYVWNQDKYTWEIPIGKYSKRRLNRESIANRKK